MRTRLLLLPAAILVLALSACGGGTPAPSDAGGPTDSATPTPDPTPIQQEDVETAESVSVGTIHIEAFSDDGGTVADVTVTQSAAVVVPVLTEVFGAEPVVSDHAGGLETAPSRWYDWSGFTLIDPEGLTIMNTDLIVSVSTPAVGSVRVYTYSGLQVGAPMADAIAVQDDGYAYPDFTVAQVGTMAIDPASVGEAPGMELAVFAAVYGAPGGGGAITSFISPSPNWGV